MQGNRDHHQKHRNAHTIIFQRLIRPTLVRDTVQQPRQTQTDQVVERVRSETIAARDISIPMSRDDHGRPMRREIRGPGSDRDAHDCAADVPPLAQQSQAQGEHIGENAQPQHGHAHRQDRLVFTARSTDVRNRAVDEKTNGKREKKEQILHQIGVRR